jgi:hypothetical protein
VAIRRSQEIRRQVTDGAVESAEKVPQESHPGVVSRVGLRDSLAEHRHGGSREDARPDEESSQTKTPPPEILAAAAREMNPD